ncbi:MAG: hypothetical protein IPK62_07135 [Bacteroidetes bacterium]|nr:hypothetical protein [Bacteroidota bacterium]MBK8144777.1 hypothetical protein [Bacteroidota bacterium]MBP6316240.1 hypothetical protein [Chitinophagaceae bacterium]
MAKLLEGVCAIKQIDTSTVNGSEFLFQNLDCDQGETVLYSFQKFEQYRHLDSFQAEIKQVEFLCDYIVQKSFKKIVLISYPGAYPFSDNLFLQHKGIIEQLFVATKIPCTILKVQGICNPPLQVNNFHQLFYHYKSAHYIIPYESNNVIYSSNIMNLASIISQAQFMTGGESYDVFDQVFSLKHFLRNNSHQIPIKTRPLLFLYFISMFHKFCAPTMFELFIRPGVPMYNFRTEKVFKLHLYSDIFEQLKSEQNRNLKNAYLFAEKRKLIPVT